MLAQPSRSGVAAAVAAGPRRARRGAARRAGQGLGADRRAAGARDPLGRGAAAGRRRPGRRRDERHRARRRDVGRDADRASTCRCCCRRPATSARTSPAARRSRWPRRPVGARMVTADDGFRTTVRLTDAGWRGGVDRTGPIRRRRDGAGGRTGTDADGARGPLERAAGRRLLPDPRRPVRLDAAGRPRRRRGQGGGPGRRRHPHLGAAGPRRRLDVLPRRQPQQAVDRARPRGRRPTPRWPASSPRRADVLLENFKPGGLARFGLDYDTVAAANPGVVYASISGFGTGGGPSLPGYDLIVQAISGLMSLTGDPAGGRRTGPASRSST